MNHSPHRDESSHNNNQFKSESTVKHNLINEIDETNIKREPNASDQNENEFDLVGNYQHDKRFDNNNHSESDVKREMLSSSKKTMNDVLKLLTNKMRINSLQELRKGSTEQDFENKMWVPSAHVPFICFYDRIMSIRTTFIMQFSLHAFLNINRNEVCDFSFFSPRSDLTIDPLKYVDLPENLQERDKYYLYSEMILKLQMARDHLLRQQSEKSVSWKP